MEDTGFREFRATLDGTKLGSSILHKNWSDDGVLQQLSVDGCPLGKGEVVVVGWPGNHFKVVRQDRREIQFDMVVYQMDMKETGNMHGMNDKTLNVVRELGFNNCLSVDRASTETVFFLGPDQVGGRREDAAHATEEAILDFISYYENQIKVAKDYLANGRNNKTHEWTRISDDCHPSVEAQVVVQEILRSSGCLDYSKVRRGAEAVDAFVNKMRTIVKYLRFPMDVSQIPPEGGEVFCSWGTALIAPGETRVAVLEMELPFVLDYVLMPLNENPNKLFVVDLTSADRSLFASPGPFPASYFELEERRRPTVTPGLTKIWEKLNLKIVNQGDKATEFHAVAVGRCFNTNQEATDWLSARTSIGSTDEKKVI